MCTLILSLVKNRSSIAQRGSTGPVRKQRTMCRFPAVHVIPDLQFCPQWGSDARSADFALRQHTGRSPLTILLPAMHNPVTADAYTLAERLVT